jgi:hypothetical protein
MKTRHLFSIGIASLAMLLSSCASSGGAASSGVKPYTKDICLVTDSKLGSMGDPVREVYQGQELKFCCKACITKFHKNPAKYLAKL